MEQNPDMVSKRDIDKQYFIQNINTLLKEFIEYVKGKVDESLKEGKIQKREISRQYYKWKVEKFEYSMNSNPIYNAHDEYITKNQIIYLHDLDITLSETPEFNEFVDRLNDIYKKEDIQFKLHSFLRAIINDYLYNNRVDQELINLFIKELNDEPIPAKVIIYLQGLTLEDTSINLTNSCVLRRITKDDLEVEIPYYGPFYVPNPLHADVTAILDIEKDVLSPIELQNEAEKAIVILRLFKVGGPKIVSYRMLGRSITRFIQGIVSTPRTQSTPRILKIYSKDVPQLKKFWREFNTLNLSSLLEINRTSDLENVRFAYQRYCDSLLQIGSFEQQVTNVIIGLEALYSNDSQEISKFLRLRVSKFLGLAGLNPRHVQDVLKDAYSIRSYFVHGNKISYKKRKEIMNKYKSNERFLIEVLEYLRISIIIFLIMQMEKDELLDWIDDSLIDKTREEQLSNQLKDIMKRFAIEIEV